MENNLWPWFLPVIHEILHVCVLSHFGHVQLFVTLWTIACRVPLSMVFARQEYWCGLPCPLPENLPNPGIEPSSLMSSALTVGSLPLAPPGNPHAAAAAATSLQSCPTLCDAIDGSPPASSVPGILQARTLEWVAISFSNACMHAKLPQSCQTLCDPIDSSSPGSSVHRIL